MSVENMTSAMTYKGPICDTLGFTQHGMNCATDTILQVLMFTDGLKATTQRTLYTITHDEIVARTRAVFPPEEHEFMIHYFELIQERFQNHYDALQCELEFKEGCESLANALVSSPSCPLLKRKHTRSPELATASKIALKSGDTRAEGVSYERMQEVLPYILRWFRLPYGITYEYDPYTTRACLLITRTYRAGDTSPRPELHLCAVLRCGSRWYFYTNTHGLFHISSMFISIIDEIWIIYYKNRILFVRHADDRVIGVWIGNRELRTPKAINLVADSYGQPHPGAIIQKIEGTMYISKIPVVDRMSPTEQDELLGKVAEILDKDDDEHPSPRNVRKAFRSLARTYGKPSTRRHKRILNIGNTIVSRMDPSLIKKTRKQSKAKKQTRKRHRGGYIPTARNLKYLRLWKKHKSIGFTMRSSLKAKGLIPRADGTYRVSDKYKTPTR